MPKRKKRKSMPEQFILEGETRIVPIDSVKPWTDNPRVNKEAVPKLAELLAQYGQVTEIVVWEKDNTIRKGNTTWYAMKHNRASQVKVMFARFKDQETADLYGLSDNKASEWSDWDTGKLALILSRKESLKMDLVKATGFTEREIDGIEKASAGLAAQNFAEAKEEFEKKNPTGKKDKAFWLWFEVHDEGAFEAVRKQYGLTDETGKRHGARELDWDILRGAMIVSNFVGYVKKKKKKKVADADGLPF